MSSVLCIPDKMSVSIEIKSKIVLLTNKFELGTIVKRKLQSDFGKNTPTEQGIRTIFERFCETGSVEDRSRSERRTVINQEKVDEVNNFLQSHHQNQVFGLLRKARRYHKQQHIELSMNIYY